VTGPAPEFRAVTWNVYAPTPVAKLGPILRDQLAEGVTVLLMNEAGGGDISRMLREAGLQSYAHGQWRVAWDPDVWVKIATRSVRLSDTHYFGRDGRTRKFNDAAEAILCDRAGRSLTAVSYHTAAHVQTREDNRPARRYRAMVESFRELGDMAEDSLTTGWLAGGDDNWDESKGLQTSDTVPVFLGADTGLRQVPSPTGTSTHGKVKGGRRIDDFRIIRGGRLRPGRGWVADGGGDHRLHGRVFRWVL
jgi:hypothetical protein